MKFSAAVFRSRDFRSLLSTRVMITLALQIQAVIVGWQVYQIRHEAIYLGLLGLMEAIPAIACSFFSGHFVDRHRPAQIYFYSLLLLAINATVLLMAVLPLPFISDAFRIGVFFSTVFVSGVARSFATPSVFSIYPLVVDRSLIPSAMAWNSSSYQFSAIFGPIAGGLVYASLGPTLAFGTILVFSLFALFGIRALSREIREYQNENKHERFIESVTAGIHFVARDRILLSSMLLDMFSVLFGGAVAVLPMFADQVLHVGPSGLGFLRAAPAVGSFLVLFFLGVRPLETVRGKSLLVVVFGFGCSMIAFGLSNSMILSIVSLFASGAFDGVSMVMRSTILQLRTPQDMRGRVSALSTVFITSSNEIGAFESGFAASLMGLVPSVVFGGCATIVVVLLTTLAFPELRKVRLRSN